MTDLTAQAFLEQLWGARLPHPELRIQTWTLATKRALLLRAPAGATVYAGRPDVYTCVALCRDRKGPGRPAAADSRAITGLWLDLDVNGGPDRKTGACPTIEAAEELARAVAEPTITVRSGYGLHAWWLFDEPWVFATLTDQDQAARAAAQWFELHRRAGAKVGAGVDHAHDLARLMRLPGTVNAKGNATAPVTGVLCGPRHNRAALLNKAATAGPTAAQRAWQPADAAPVTVAARAGAEIPDDKLAAALHNLPEFAAAWQHRRGAGWSLSEYDLALCSIAIQAGWTDQDLADLIVHHRRRFEPDGAKAGRPDYLRRTIARARRGHEIHTAAYGDLTAAGVAHGQQTLAETAMRRAA